MPLRKLWDEVLVELDAARRFYALDDQYAVHIAIEPSGFYGDHLRAAMALHERAPHDPDDRRSDGTEAVYWDCIDLESLPARHWMRVAELKVMVERWNAGELEEHQFPPSTAPNFLEAQEAAQRSRRTRRRRYT